MSNEDYLFVEAIEEMNERVVKKLRQYTRRNWRQFYQDIKKLPFKNRLGIAWWILFGRQSEK